MRFAAALMLVAITGCSDEAKEKEKSPTDLLRAKMVRELKDPDSAKFRDEVLRDGVLCGEVNAKSSMGGYIGFKRFVSADSFFAISGEVPHFEETVEPSMIERQAELQKLMQLEKKAVYVAALDSGEDLPSTEELHIAEFAALWGKFCDAP